MVDAGWVRYTPYALVGAVTFEFMHIADELAGNWAPFEPMNDPLVATFSMGIFTLVAMGSLWWVVENRSWGYAVAALFGLFFLLAELWHLVDAANMTALRWGIVLLAQVCAALVLVLGTYSIRVNRPL